MRLLKLNELLRPQDLYMINECKNRKTYATKNKDITKCFDRAIKQCGHNHIKLEYIVCCDDDYINKLIEKHEAIII